MLQYPTDVLSQVWRCFKDSKISLPYIAGVTKNVLNTPLKHHFFLAGSASLSCSYMRYTDYTLRCEAKLGVLTSQWTHNASYTSSPGTLALTDFGLWAPRPEFWCKRYERHKIFSAKGLMLPLQKVTMKLVSLFVVLKHRWLRTTARHWWKNVCTCSQIHRGLPHQKLIDTDRGLPNSLM